MFDLRSARYFVAVAEELHFGKAAERLQMSQPPLSQAIRQLERDVGAALFTRTNRRVALTAAGEAFLPECRELLLRADAAAETPRLAAAGIRASATIGAVASALTWPLPDALAMLREQAPHIAIRVHEIDTHEVVDSLEHGRIDIALARLSSQRTGLRSQVLLRDEFCVVVPDDHPLANETGPVDLGQLADSPWIWLQRDVSPDYHDDMTAACRASGFRPRARHWARSIASQIALVRCGVGVTVIPQTMATDLPGGIIARSIRNPTQAVTMAVTTRINPEPAERLIVRLIADVIASRLTNDIAEPRPALSSSS